MTHLYGITSAMITPFNKNGNIDHNALAHLTTYLIDKGVNCLYPCGTTGEMLRLSLNERKQAANTVIRAASGRVPVFIHCGAATYKDTSELLAHAESAGADGAGIVTPQFFHAEETELINYYTSLAKSVPDFPIYIYNIPQCSGNDLLPETAETIQQLCPNIIGIKYSYPDINRTIDYLAINDHHFSVMHGCDRALSAILSLGCDGTVSGIAGVFPEPFVKVYKAFKQNDIRQMQYWQNICIRFCDILKCGSNMSYFKEALKLRGITDSYMRLPQLSIDSGERDILKTRIYKLCDYANIPVK